MNLWGLRGNLFNEVTSMLRKVIIFDFLVALLGAIIIQAIYRAYVIHFLLGLALAAISFAVSGAITRHILESQQGNRIGIINLINFLKVFAVCIIGVLVFNNNINNVISYMMGFTSHLAALVLYGIFSSYAERK